METMDERIKRLRIAKGLSQEELANKCGFTSRSSISKIEKGLRDIRQGQILAIAKALNVAPQYLMDGIEPNAEIPSQTQVPLFASVSAGFGSTREEAIGSFPVTNGGKDVIAVLVSGDSMSPTIADGDTIIVKRQTSVDYGDIAVVRVDEEHFVKKVEYTPEYIRLVSLNEKYPPIVLTGKDVLRCSVEGKVIGSYKRW
jgi:repressor LexA